MREGSLDAPTRHPIAWQDPAYTDPEAVEKELERVFDICHGCRRCFNLCDSFPRLFDLVDEAPTQELDSVDPANFKSVVDACTLCDMCFLTKCPYVPPHEFNLDFPHLMLRYRAMEERQGKVALRRQATGGHRPQRQAGRDGLVRRQLGHAPRQQDRRPARCAQPPACTPTPNCRNTPASRWSTCAAATPVLNREAPAFGRKAVLYATCFGNYNSPDVGLDTRAVLARNGVETEVAYPGCCGMPLLEQGRLADVARSAQNVAQSMKDWIAKGYDVIALVPSCALMLKFEWPLILPDDPDVATLAKATFDISEYIVDIAKKEGIAPGLAPTPATMTLHMACHARAQNMGQKAAEMLRLVPQATVKVIERCSGHGGSWGFKQEHFEVGMKVGRPVFRQAAQNGAGFVMSECPLAGVHIQQGIERLGGDGEKPTLVTHPIQILARAYEGAA